MMGQMLRNSRRVLWGASASVLFAGAASYAQPARHTITVGTNVQVSAARPHWQHFEVMLAVDPRDPDLMIACSIVLVPEKAKHTTVVYSSRDGGATWKPTLAALDPKMKLSSDPACLFTPQGTAIFSYEVAFQSLPDTFVINRSDDGGATWPYHARLSVASRYLDRQFLVATDRSLYMTAATFRKSLDADGPASLLWGLALLRSEDNGKTWKWAPTRFAPTGKIMGEPGNCAVSPDHALLCAFGESSTPEAPVPAARYAPEAIKVAVSRDGGESLGLPVTVASTPGSGTMDSIPHIAVDHGSKDFSNRAYLVWGNVLPDGSMQILCAHSADDGATWSSATIVGENESGVANYMPQIAVNPGGVVGVMWYHRNGVDDAGYTPEFAASFDGGDTFTAPVKISKADQVVGGSETWPIFATVSGQLASPFEAAGAPKKTGAIEMTLMRFPKHATGGETTGLVADRNGVFHALWTDDRTGFDQLWTAAIKVTGQAARFGDPALSACADVTDRMRMSLVSWSNTSNKSFSVVVRLKNVGATPLLGPLRLRILSITSQVGRVTMVNSDNRATGRGALWNVSGADRASSLPPGGWSQPITLRFALTGARPWLGRGSTPRDLRVRGIIGNIRFQVLAPPEK